MASDIFMSPSKFNCYSKLIMRSLSTNCLLGESPLYDRSNQLAYWLDLNLCYLYIYNLKKNKLSKFKLKLNAPLGSLFLTSKKNLIITSNSGVHFLNTKTKKLNFLLDPRKDKKNLIFNDGISETNGLYIGVSHKKEKLPIGYFYKFDGKNLKIIIDKFPVANGPSIFKDKVVYSNSAQKTLILQSKRNSKIIFKKPIRSGYPDGSCFDTEGGLWLAHWGVGRVSRFKPNLKLDFSIKLPAKNTSSVCFIGPKRDQLLVTTAKVDTSKKDLKKFPLSGDTFILKTNFKGEIIKSFDEKHLKKLKLLHRQH